VISSGVGSGLPSPFCTEDLHPGYVYQLAFRQFEVSETIVFDRPQANAHSAISSNEASFRLD
jgi:hypothetical protein